MKVKDVKELLNQFPDDMDFIIIHDGDCFETQFNICQESVNHCTYSTNWENNVERYSIREVIHSYTDYVNGKLVKVELPMNSKEVALLEFYHELT